MCSEKQNQQQSLFECIRFYYYNLDLYLENIFLQNFFAKIGTFDMFGETIISKAGHIRHV